MQYNQISLTIPGLVPGSNTGSLLTALREMDGVLTANFSAGKVLVQYDPDKTGLSDLKATVAVHGYEVSAFAVEEEEETCYSGG